MAPNDFWQAVTGILVVAGSGFCFIAALGLVRLQDVLIRMHASSKAGTLGVGLILLSSAVLFQEMGIITRVLAAIAFMMITAPIAAHMIGRAAYACGARLWPGTVVDELHAHHLGQPHAGTTTSGDQGQG